MVTVDSAWASPPPVLRTQHTRQSDAAGLMWVESQVLSHTWTCQPHVLIFEWENMLPAVSVRVSAGNRWHTQIR